MFEIRCKGNGEGVCHTSFTRKFYAYFLDQRTAEKIKQHHVLRIEDFNLNVCSNIKEVKCVQEDIRQRNGFIITTVQFRRRCIASLTSLNNEKDDRRCAISDR